MGTAQASTRVLIVSSDKSAVYVQAADELMAALTRKGVPASAIGRVDAAEWATAPEALSVPDIYVALGTLATHALAQRRVTAPVLAALLPRASFERELRVQGLKASTRFTAIYLDQPLHRQLAMIQIAMPKVQRLSVLTGPDSTAKTPLLRAAAKSRGLTLQEVVVSSEETLFDDLQRALASCDALLALADPLVFNSGNIQNILRTTFRAQVPMVAFSPGYVRAGALMALFTTPAQAGRQAASLVFAVLEGKSLPQSPVEADDFEVEVNANVAKALDMSIDSVAVRDGLKRLENLR